MDVCCISLYSDSRIRLISVPEGLLYILRSAIVNSWGKIEKEKDYCGGYQFRLHGCPWMGYKEDGVKSRKVLVSLIKCMAQNGWNIIQATDTSRRDDNDAMFFECSQPDPEVDLFALSFNGDDRIRLIDAPDVMQKVLRQAVLVHSTIKDERDYHGAFEIRLSGLPWDSDDSEGMTAKTTLCQILSNFKTAGYKLYASVNMSYGNSKGYDLETWIFRKTNPLWQ